MSKIEKQVFFIKKQLSAKQKTQKKKIKHKK